MTKKEDKNRVNLDARHDILFKNYDYGGSEEGGETSPGRGLYNGNMDKYKSVKDFINHVRKRKAKKRKKVLATIASYLSPAEPLEPHPIPTESSWGEEDVQKENALTVSPDDVEGLNGMGLDGIFPMGYFSENQGNPQGDYFGQFSVESTVSKDLSKYITKSRNKNQLIKRNK